MSDPSDRATERLWLADWRRRVAELYAEVRTVAATDPAARGPRGRAEREALYRGHPSSPVLPAERATFAAHHWPYDDRLRFEVAVEPVVDDPSPLGGLGGLALPNSGAEALAFDRVGRVTLPLPGGAGTLVAVLDAWLHGRPVPAVPGRDERRGDVRGRPVRPRHRRRARTSAATRPPER